VSAFQKADRSAWFPVLVLAALGAGAAHAQIQVYSEFAQIDAKGEVTAPESPREILSPAIARNAFTSFQVVIRVPDGTPWRLYIGQNPPDAVQVTLYRQNAAGLERVAEPVTGDKTQVLWMDLWADRRAPVQRIKVEPQLNVLDDWVIYPMEVRVMEATVPDGQRQTGSLAPVEIMRAALCGTKSPESPSPKGAEGVSRASLQFRNAQQDLAMVTPGVRPELTKLFGACDATAPSNPEWYLRIRDYLYRQH
jgi:hypothetical protein